MKGNEEVIAHLQTALTMELTAVRQYLLHAMTWFGSDVARQFWPVWTCRILDSQPGGSGAKADNPCCGAAARYRARCYRIRP